MNAEMPTISDAQIAALIERVDNLVTTQAELKGMIAAQSAALGAIPVMQAQLGEYNEKFTRAFNSIRAAQDTANDAAKRTEFHSNVFKGVWVLVIASLGLIGWGWNQLERARERDAAMDRRVLLTEYKLGIIPVAEGGKQ